MKYFSTFAGIGGFEVAIHSVFPNAICVGYSEIDKYAIQIYQKHFPNHKNFGDIVQIDIDNLPDFDLLIGGSPCQDLSIAKKNREGLEGSRSGLFYKFVEILEKKKPKYFLFENVASMSEESQSKINKILGEASRYSNILFPDYIKPVMINAALVSAQNRKRLFWANFSITQPEDKGILLKDILEDEVDEKYFLNDSRINYVLNKSKNYQVKINPNKTNTLRTNYGNASANETYVIRIGQIYPGQGGRIYSIEGKTVTQVGQAGGDGEKTGLYLINNKSHYLDANYYKGIRKLTPIECERLQTFPDNWTEGISNTQRYKTLGNAVCVEVIKHILQCLKGEGDADT